MSVKTNSRFAVLAGAAFTSVLALSAAANAAIMISYNGGAPIIDNAAGDLDPAVGSIINNSFVAGFGVTITVGTSNSPGTPSGGVLQVSSLDIHNNGAGTGTLSVRVSDTGFTSPGIAGTPMVLTSSYGGTFTGAAVGNTASFQSFADPANAQPAAAAATVSLIATKVNPLAATESFDGANGTVFVHGAGAYSLSNLINVSLVAGGQANISGTSTATAVVPEPMTLGALAGAVALIARRRRA